MRLRFWISEQDLDFFSVILAEAGYKVTAVDYTQEMLDTAKRNAGNLCERISFL